METELRKKAFEKARKGIKKALSQRDALIIQTINAADELDKGLNVFSERMREWYSLHFPELNKKIKDHHAYLKYVLKGERKNIQDLKYLAENSAGAEFREEDYDAMKQHAAILLELYRQRDMLSDYIKKIMEAEAPNINSLIGPAIGARLIALAGGLKNLSQMPASTIQVLGAEKALFRHLRTGAPPPKYGVLFQLPVINKSQKDQQGKIARALASKTAIASRIDFYSKKLNPTIKRDFEKRLKEIRG